MVGATVGFLGSQWSMAAQNEKVMKGYSGYLDRVAAEGRAERDRALYADRNMEYDNGRDRTSSFVADIEARRAAQTAMQGNSR